MFDIVLDAFSAFALYLKRNPRLRTRLVWSAIVGLLLASLLGGILSQCNMSILGEEITFKSIEPFFIVIFVMSLFILLIAALSLADNLIQKDGDRELIYEILGLPLLIGGGGSKTKTTKPTGRKKTAPEPAASADDIYSAIRLNLAHLVEYYVINKGQARRSFTMSVVAISVGFLTIIVGIWLSYREEQSNQNPAYISVIGGIILQFIGGAFFFLYNRSLVQLNYFFGRLAVMQDTMLAVELAKTIDVTATKNSVLEKLIFTIVTRDQKAPDYAAPWMTPAAEKPAPKSPI
jgi:protein-S-isoprenylcysteine O-methyltransferase Ste14